MDLLSSSDEEQEAEEDEQEKHDEANQNPIENPVISHCIESEDDKEEDLLQALFEAPSPASQRARADEQNAVEPLHELQQLTATITTREKPERLLPRARLGLHQEEPDNQQHKPHDLVASCGSQANDLVEQPCANADVGGKQIVSARELLMRLCPKATQQILPTKPSYEFHYRTPPKTRPPPPQSRQCPRPSPPQQERAQATLDSSDQEPNASCFGSSGTPSPEIRESCLSRPRVSRPSIAGRDLTPPSRQQRLSQSPATQLATPGSRAKPAAYVSPFLAGNNRKGRLDPALPARASNTEIEAEDDLWFSDNGNDKHVAEEEEEGNVDSDRPRKQPRRSLTPLRESSPKEPRKYKSATIDDNDEEHEIEHFDDGEDRWPRLPGPDLDADQEAGAPAASPLVLSSTIQVCASINRLLFDYQREGIQFLYHAYENNTGAILGDEMGLGKTIQVIALLSSLLHKRGDSRDKAQWRECRAWRRENQFDLNELGDDDQLTRNRVVLIVMPASLLQNWQLELHVWMFCSVVLLIGPRVHREELLERIRGGEYEIVLCSYDMLKIHETQLRSMQWHVVVLDEMHCLKNPEAQTTKAVLALKHCKRKIGLTGTLMQNNEEELHCLLNAIAPGCAGSLAEFRAFYADDIKYGRKKSAAPEAIARSREKEAKLRNLLSGIYLRRDKQIHPTFEQIAKKDVVVFCELTPLQKKVYENILNLPEYQALRRISSTRRSSSRRTRRRRSRVKHRQDDEEETSSEDAEEEEEDPPEELDLEALQRDGVLWKRFHASEEPCRRCPNCISLVCVAQLLKLSNHVDLLKVNASEPNDEIREFTSQFASKVFGDDLEELGGLHQSNRFVDMKDTRLCGKMQVLAKLLALWQTRRHKALIFSRSTRMLDILQMFVIGKGIAYVRLDGHTKISERLALVQRFNRDATLGVFLISTKAGGLGLNMTSARHVVLFDPSWNPAHDCQAQDRAYRLGQTHDVHVYRLITLGTIEEMIYVRQIYKQQLADTTLKGLEPPRYFEAIQGVPGQQGELFGIRNLLQLKEGGVLKGIQDAYYKREAGSDLVMRETEVDYQQLAATEKGLAASSVLGVSNPRSRARKISREGTTPKGNGKRRPDDATDAVNTMDADAEMVQVADEMLQLVEEDQLEEQEQEESELCRQAARRMLCHEDIVHEASRRTSLEKNQRSKYPRLALVNSSKSSRYPLERQVEAKQEDDEVHEQTMWEGTRSCSSRPSKIYIPKYL